MAILTYDTSSRVCTVALGDKNKLLVEHTLNLDYTHSDYLLSLIEQSLAIANLTTSNVDAIGVIRGPGSFTGLRIGLTVAKGLALATNCKVFTFTSLELLATMHWGAKEPVLTIVPAQRGEVYAGLFDCSNGRPVLIDNYFIGKLSDQVKLKVEGLSSFYVVGSEYQQNEQEIDKVFGDRVIQTTSVHKIAKASLILPLVNCELKNNKQSCDIDTLEPFYMRLSAAEQNRLDKENNKKC